MLKVVPKALDGTVECREHAAPDAKVTAENGSARLDGSECCKDESDLADCCSDLE